MKNYKILLFFLFIFAISSCDKIADLEENDPNNFKDAPADLIINTPLLANALVAEGELARISNIFSDQFTGADRQYLSFEKYLITAGDFSNIWSTLYADGVAQCKLIQEKATLANDPHLKGISQIVEANLIGLATSLWGDVPFTQAGNVDKFPEPSFDDQLAVYAGLQSLLDEAIANVGNATVTEAVHGSETVDQTVRANMRWKEIAYSLKSRFYLHVKDYPNALANAKLGIPSSDAEWLINHDDGGNWIDGKFNIYFSFCAWYRGGYLGASDAYLPKLLDASATEYRGDTKTDEAGRLAYYYAGSSGSWDPNTGKIWSNSSPFPVFSWVENKLIEAESEWRGGSKANALDALNEVRAYWNKKFAGKYSEYVDTDFASDADLLSEILEEKYISLHGQIEVFNDLRRTDNHIGVPIKSGSKFPERFIYPQSEINSNPNTPEIKDIYTPTKVNS
ncbi:SusD/RagB family nutrient-binding outer membrane lipoprotein [Marinifilum caeruleilacunae]|uniref:SusD/RagB family nutrient-binding outer membrane lipoprotein n=1 Tax=Marinifilum caeruleilacunae TaxID=2499076 RepID=A0ABX1WVV3_9BACT|nr:SusD/RagB family nutrient-binding outer membrane lipoprotein [Marinifilum caeruleilacunae]NOU60038.1 SusD/RagB family nutrient-binding outer membrane lipoprotein [Marinifilum caeruleilacunae]